MHSLRRSSQPNHAFTPTPHARSSDALSSDSRLRRRPSPAARPSWRSRDHYSAIEPADLPTPAGTLSPCLDARHRAVLPEHAILDIYHVCECCGTRIQPIYVTLCLSPAVSPGRSVCSASICTVCTLYVSFTGKVGGLCDTACYMKYPCVHERTTADKAYGMALYDSGTDGDLEQRSPACSLSQQLCLRPIQQQNTPLLQKYDNDAISSNPERPISLQQNPRTPARSANPR